MMNFPIPKLKRRGTVLLTTMLILVGAFSYYFLGYVKSRESQLVSRSYRVLERKASNIINKHVSYSGYLKFVSSSIRNSIKEVIGNRVVLDDKASGLGGKIDALHEQVFDLEDSRHLRKKLRKSGNKIDSMYKEIDALYKLYQGRNNANSAEWLKSEIEKRAKEVSGIITLNSFYYAPAKYRYTNDVHNEFNWIVREEDKSYFSFSESPKTFIKPLLDVSEDGLFDHFLLLKENGVEESENIHDKYTIIYQTLQNQIDLQSIQTQGSSGFLGFEDQSGGNKMYQELGPKTVEPVNVQLFNKGYKLMFHRFTVRDETFGKDQVYYLGGLVGSSTFNKESKKVEVFWIVISILVLLVLIISMPILKLSFMSAIERLHISNVLATAGAIILGVPVFLLIIFCIYDFVIIGNNERFRQLKRISDHIEASFEEEVELILKGLTQFDTQVAEGKAVRDLDISDYPEFNHLFWIDAQGFASRQRGVVEIDTNARILLKERDYFKKVVNDQMWTFTTDSATYDFYLQSIVSWTDVTNEAALSIPSRIRSENGDKEFLVAAMTSQLRSVMDPIMPLGFGFAIIDDKGNVYFHSEKGRILQENLLVETNNDSELRAAIYSRIGTDTNINYRNDNHKAYIRPINSLPLYLVTFFNNDIRNAEIQGVTSISIFLLFGTFAAVCFMILVLFLIQKRRSKLKIKRFLFHWLKPDSDRCINYFFLTMLFLLIGLFLLLMVSWRGAYEQDVLFTFVITNAYLFLISYTWLTSSEEVKYRDNRSYKLGFNAAFVLVILVANLIYYDLSSKSGWWIIFQIVLTTIIAFGKKLDGYFHAFFASKIISKRNFHRIVERHAYNSFLFTWLLISSILPVFYIFMVSHNQEKLIWEKVNQLEIAKQYQEKVRSLNTRVKSVVEEDSLKYHFFQSKIDAGQYLLGSKIYIDKSKAFNYCANAYTQADYFLSKARPHYSDLIIRSKGLVYDVSEEKNHRWCFSSEKDRSTVQLSYRDNFGPVSRTDSDTIYVTGSVDLLSAVMRSSKGKSGEEYRWVFYLVVILILIAVYCLIDYCINKIYGREYVTFKNTLPLSVDNFKKISIGDDSITHHKQRQILLLGLPKSNKSNLIKAIEGNIFRIDLIHINHGEQWKEIESEDFGTYDGVIIENFEYGITAHSANVIRLKLVEKVVFSNIDILIISSNVHPSFITNFYQSKLKKFNEDGLKLKEEYEHALETWRHILGGFVIVHNPIKINTKINDFLQDSWITNKTLKDLFIGELNRGSFLPNLLPALKDYFVKLREGFGGDETKISKEDLILRIQLLAESYYLGLWNSLSKEEQYIIYDLAKDRFVNINNRNGIRSLLEKGLLVYDSQLRIMNESFTNYVLSIIKKEEALRMEQEVREKGTWSSISSVIGLTVLGIMTFLFLGNPDFFHDFDALIGAIAAIIGILPRLTGLLNIRNASALPGK